MIKTFSDKGLSELFETGSSRKIGSRYKAKALRCLDLLNNADSLNELQVPGFDFHRLHGKPTRYAMKVSANYRITFGWQKGAIDVDIIDYH
jgi:toxin HigB-1